MLDLSFDDYIEMIQRNMAVLRSSWDAKAKEDARKIAAVAAEQLADFIRDY